MVSLKASPMEVQIPTFEFYMNVMYKCIGKSTIQSTKLRMGTTWFDCAPKNIIFVHECIMREISTIYIDIIGEYESDVP